MAVIKIAVNDVNDINEILNSIKTSTGNVKNSVSGMKHTVYSNIQGRRDIGNRIQNVTNKIGDIENDLSELYAVINYSTNSYSKTESDLKKELENRI